MLIPKTNYIRDKRHLKFLSTLPCVISGKSGECQAAHIRSGCHAGIGLKSGDNCALPLDHIIHAEQHKTGSEAKFWAKYGGIDKAIELANGLHVRTGDYGTCVMMIARFRRNFHA